MQVSAFITHLNAWFIIGFLTMNPLPAAAQSHPQIEHLFVAAERPSVDVVLARLTEGNGVQLGEYLVLFDHYRALWSEGKTDSTFLISLAHQDQKLAESLLLFARRPETRDLRRQAFTYYVSC